MIKESLNKILISKRIINVSTSTRIDKAFFQSLTCNIIIRLLLVRENDCNTDDIEFDLKLKGLDVLWD